MLQEIAANRKYWPIFATSATTRCWGVGFPYRKPNQVEKSKILMRGNGYDRDNRICLTLNVHLYSNWQSASVEESSRREMHLFLRRGILWNSGRLLLTKPLRKPWHPEEMLQVHLCGSSMKIRTT